MTKVSKPNTENVFLNAKKENSEMKTENALNVLTITAISVIKIKMSVSDVQDLRSSIKENVSTSVMMDTMSAREENVNPVVHTARNVEVNTNAIDVRNHTFSRNTDAFLIVKMEEL